MLMAIPLWLLVSASERHSRRPGPSHLWCHKPGRHSRVPFMPMVLEALFMERCAAVPYCNLEYLGTFAWNWKISSLPLWLKCYHGSIIRLMFALWKKIHGLLISTSQSSRFWHAQFSKILSYGMPIFKYWFMDWLNACGYNSGVYINMLLFIKYYLVNFLVPIANVWFFDIRRINIFVKLILCKHCSVHCCDNSYSNWSNNPQHWPDGWTTLVSPNNDLLLFYNCLIAFCSYVRDIHLCIKFIHTSCSSVCYIHSDKPSKFILSSLFHLVRN